VKKSRPKHKPAAVAEMTQEDAIVLAFKWMVQAATDGDFAFAHRLLVAVENGQTGTMPDLSTLCTPRGAFAKVAHGKGQAPMRAATERIGNPSNSRMRPNPGRTSKGAST
jgi:hypothetical protein